MPLVIPASKTQEAARLMEEMQEIARKVIATPVESWKIEEFLALEARHHQCRLEIEALARRE